MAYERRLRQAILTHGSIAKYEAVNRAIAPTFEVFVEEWLTRYVDARNKASERKTKRTVLRAHLLPAFKKTPIDRITTKDVDLYVTEKQEAGLSPKTINNHLVVLRKCLVTAKGWDIPLTVPECTPLRVRPNTFRYLSREEIERIADSTQDPWKTMIIVAGSTGLRFSELIALDWTDVDFGLRQLTVRRGCVNGVIDSTKSNRIRYLLLTEEVCQALQGLPSRKGFIFTRDGKMIYDKSARRHLGVACKVAGIEPIGWHVLRHSFASELVRRGASLYSVKELLGHSSIEVTERYSHLSQQNLDRSVLLLEERQPMSQWRHNETPGHSEWLQTPPHLSSETKEKVVLHHDFFSGSEGGDRNRGDRFLPESS